MMSENTKASATAWLPDLIYTGGRFERGLALICDESGRIMRLSPDTEGATRVVRLKGRALLPGMTNAHSHAFQRVIRGRTELRSHRTSDTFWTWREMMYSAAERLTPEDIYDASRMAFLEMALGGITAVGEFHYIHHAPDGSSYDDPNLLAKEVTRAARDVGLRIALLRVAYARAGFHAEPNPRQARFIEEDPRLYLSHLDKLASDLAAQDTTGEFAWAGAAPHSVRAVPLHYLREVASFAAAREMPTHMHVAEQPAEIEACRREHARTPVALLDHEGLLRARFTAVHAIHLLPEEVRALADTGAIVCACPTTERNLGDGVVPADALMRAGVPITLGTDSHAQIDLLEDARELEYHLRLRQLQRAVLAPPPPAPLFEFPSGEKASDTDQTSALAARLFACATRHGAASISAPGGELEMGRPADFFTVDLNDPTIAGAGANDLLSSIVFSLSRAAIRDVVVAGKPIVEDGRHAAQQDSITRFAALQRKLWE